MTSRARRWVFTIFQNIAATVQLLQALPVGEEVRYIIFQEEECPETQRRHIQGYAEFTRPYRRGGVQQLFGGGQFRCNPARGTADQNREYCSKADTRVDGPWEAGTPARTTQGQRVDLEAVRTAVAEGSSLSVLYEEHFGAMARYSRAILAYRQLIESGRTRDVPPVVRVYYGTTGTGKTRRAYDEARAFGTPYWVPVPERHGLQAWFDSYDGTSPLIIDEFSGEFGLNFTKRILDRYPCQLPVKGGFVSMQTKQIWITSQKDPDEWFPEASPEDRAAIRRRCQTIIRFGTLGGS
ncbi:hypothetical protein [uncultured marine virus]|uniref:CRESS-DNA virus Rep endonuclease domain-containing protein n=1 Tax=uncultured marine virus TaxID=186617 RepID=S4TEI4_9VIRU|nr:hypothetical protein [uncultured marine virus]